MIHKIKISKRRVLIDNPRFVQGGINADKISLETSDYEWLLCDTILVTLKNSSVEKPMTLLFPGLGSMIDVPKSILAEPGVLYISFTGYKKEQMRVTTEAMNNFQACKVVPSGIIASEGEDAQPDQLDYLGELIDQVDDILGKIEDGTLGPGGSLNYEALVNLPTINGHQMVGNMAIEDLGLGSIDSDTIERVTAM